MWLHHPKIWLDISTYCNAACPQCHRTNPDGLGKADWLPLMQWDLDTFKKAFPSPAAIHEFTFCGTWGDPMMNKDVLGIVEYIAKHSSTPIKFNTNGSMRNPEWWWELGNVGGILLEVSFDIDGTTQEMHSLYRQKTDLETALEHMEELASTQAAAFVNTIVFKHNQEHLSDISKMVMDRGASRHLWWPSDRFGTFNDFKTVFTDEDGIERILEPAEANKLNIWTDHKYQSEYYHEKSAGWINFKKVMND